MFGEVRRVVAHIEKVHFLDRALGTEWWYGSRLRLPVLGIEWRLFRIGRMLGQPFEVVEFDEVLDVRPLRVCVKQRCILDFAASTHQWASP
jgi:hypothetical protein